MSLMPFVIKSRFMFLAALSFSVATRLKLVPTTFPDWSVKDRFSCSKVSQQPKNRSFQVAFLAKLPALRA